MRELTLRTEVKQTRCPTMNIVAQNQYVASPPHRQTMNDTTRQDALKGLPLLLATIALSPCELTQESASEYRRLYKKIEKSQSRKSAIMLMNDFAARERALLPAHLRTKSLSMAETGHAHHGYA
jgi:hypothetical protein